MDNEKIKEIIMKTYNTGYRHGISDMLDILVENEILKPKDKTRLMGLLAEKSAP